MEQHLVCFLQSQWLSCLICFSTMWNYVKHYLMVYLISFYLFQSAGRDSFDHKKSSPPHQRKSEENVQPSSPSNDGGKCCPKRKDNLTFEETSVKTEGNLGVMHASVTFFFPFSYYKRWFTVINSQQSFPKVYDLISYDDQNYLPCSPSFIVIIGIAIANILQFSKETLLHL